MKRNCNSRGSCFFKQLNFSKTICRFHQNILRSHRKWEKLFSNAADELNETKRATRNQKKRKKWDRRNPDILPNTRSTQQSAHMPLMQTQTAQTFRIYLPRAPAPISFDFLLPFLSHVQRSNNFILIFSSRRTKYFSGCVYQVTLLARSPPPPTYILTSSHEGEFGKHLSLPTTAFVAQNYRCFLFPTVSSAVGGRGTGCAGYYFYELCLVQQ